MRVALVTCLSLAAVVGGVTTAHARVVEDPLDLVSVATAGEDAEGEYVAVSNGGNADSDMVAVSEGGTATAHCDGPVPWTCQPSVGASTTGQGEAYWLGASGTGPADGYVGVSGLGTAEGTVAVSVTGHACGWLLSVTVTGTAC